MKQKYNIGDIIELDGFPKSNVVGIDWYKLKSLSGLDKKWASYTLRSDEKGVFSRWWITDEEHGLYYWTYTSKENVQGKINLDDSGLCALIVEGDSIVNSSFSSVAIFQDSDILYCIEAFEEEVLFMKGERLPAHTCPAGW